MPFASSNLHVCSLLFGTPAVYGVVDGYIVFERVGAGDVVIVRVPRAPDHTTGLVFLAGNRFEFHLNDAVLEAGIVFDAHRKGSSPGLFQDVGFAGRGSIRLDRPLRLTGSRFRSRPARRWYARFQVVEVDGLSHCKA